MKPTKTQNDILEEVSTTEKEITLLVPDYKALRKDRIKPTSPEDAIALQAELIGLGYQAPAVLSIQLANESYDNMCVIRDAYGIVSAEYECAFKLANTAVNNAMPYFAAKIKTGTDLSDLGASENLGVLIGSVMKKIQGS